MSGLLQFMQQQQQQPKAQPTVPPWLQQQLQQGPPPWLQRLAQPQHQMVPPHAGGAQMTPQQYQQALHHLWQQMHNSPNGVLPQQPSPKPGTMPPGQVPFGAPAGARGGAGHPLGGMNPSSIRVDFHPPPEPQQQ